MHIILAAGDLEFVVAGWSDVIPSGFGAEVSDHLVTFDNL